MSSDVQTRDQPADVAVARKLLLIWQNPDTRVFRRVGELDELEDGLFTFRYLDGAVDASFSPLAQFPDRGKVYGPGPLPSFFRNRVMSKARDSYGEYRGWLGLNDDGMDTPAEVLLRTGGSRATDTFHVVDDLSRSSDGEVVSRFFASGIRYLSRAEAFLPQLRPGQELALRDEPDNSYNPRAVLIDASHGEPVGYVPDWLLEDLHDLRSRTSDLSIFVERINPDAPSHLKLLCRLEAIVPPQRV